MQLLLCLLFIGTCLHAQVIDFYTAVSSAAIPKLEKQAFTDIVQIYNKKYGTHLTINHQQIKTFRDVFSVVKKASTEYTSVMCSVTITKEREKHVTFSIPYLPVTETIFSYNDLSEGTDWTTKPIAFLVGTTAEDAMKSLLKTYPKIKPKAYTSFQTLIEDVKQGYIKFLISDNVAILSYPKLVPLKDLGSKKGKGYGIVYPLGSSLKEKLDPIIKYYTKSAKFYNLLQQNYGNEIADYFTANVRMLN